MKSKTTKRALLSSCVALMLCFSMLLGTTYAWFTDSETSVNNIIKSGTLDVEMFWNDDNGSVWNDVTETADPIFNYQYWEPGYVEIKYIKLKNVGDLAFKYDLTVLPNIENAGGNKLAEVLEVYCFPYAIERGDVNSESEYYLGTLNKLMGRDIIPDNGVLLPEAGKGSNDIELPAGTEAYTGEVTVCVALKMQETAGNEYQNLTIGDGFAVQLLATQFTYENDSFNNSYDDTADNTPSDSMPVAKVTYATDLIGKSTANFDWNNQFSMVDSNSGVEFDTAYVFTAPTDDASDSGYAPWLADFAVSFDRDVTAADNIGIAGKYGTWGWIGFLANNDLFNDLGIEKLEANVDYDLLGSFGINMDYATLCSDVQEFTCAAWGDPTEDLTMTVELRLYETYTEEECEELFGYKSVNEKTGNFVVVGKYSYTFGSVIDNADALVDALAAGGTIQLASDITLNKKIELPAGVEATLDLNGNTLAGAFDNQGGSALIENKGSLTIKNGTIMSLAEYPDVDWGTEGFPTYATNTISNKGNLVIGEGAVIENQTNQGGASYAVDNYAGATLTVNEGAVIKAKDVAIRMFSGSATSENKVVINGGTITGKRAVWVQLPSNNAAVAPLTTLEINGGSLNSTSDLTVYSYSYGNSFANTNVTINGGTFSNDVQFGGGYKGDTENVTITGGTFNGAVGRWITADDFQIITVPTV